MTRPPGSLRVKTDLWKRPVLDRNVLAPITLPCSDYAWENLWEKRSQCEPQSVAAGSCQLANYSCRSFCLEEKTEWLTHRACPKVKLKSPAPDLYKYLQTQLHDVEHWSSYETAKQREWIAFSYSDTVFIHFYDSSHLVTWLTPPPTCLVLFICLFPTTSLQVSWRRCILSIFSFPYWKVQVLKLGDYSVNDGWVGMWMDGWVDGQRNGWTDSF